MTALRRIVRSLPACWYEARPSQRLAYAVGSVLIGVGLLHLAGYAFIGGPWAGPVGWRKPFSFGVSFGLTAVTLGWLSGYLRYRPRTQWWLLAPLAIANSIEVAWVSLQRARGVASHFNFDTTFDKLLFYGNGVAIAVTVTVIFAMTARAVRVVDGPAGMAVAVRVALWCLVVAQFAGGLMIYQGINFGSTTWGDAGLIKVPHAVGMHGIQVLPGMAWLLSFTTLAPVRRMRVSAMASAGYALVVVVAVAQTLAGAAPWNLGVITSALLIAGVAALLVAVAATLGGLRGAGPVAA